MFKKLKSVNWQKSIGCYLFIYLFIYSVGGLKKDLILKDTGQK